jgi:hypothetical protein
MNPCPICHYVSAATHSPAYCTLMLTVAVLLASFGSGVSARVAAFAVIIVPDEAVTLLRTNNPARRWSLSMASPAYSTAVLTVAVLLAMFGSGVSAMVAALSVMTEPEDAVTLTVSRTVHVVFGAMLLFSWQTNCPVPWYGGCVQVPSPGVPEMRM